MNREESRIWKEVELGWRSLRQRQRQRQRERRGGASLAAMGLKQLQRGGGGGGGCCCCSCVVEEREVVES